MKKKFFALILSMVAMTSCFVGCSGGEKTPAATENKDVVVLSSFNEVRELRSFKYSSYFGKVSLNTDEKYITEGEKSAKLLVDTRSKTAVSMDIFTNTAWNNFSDFTKVQALTMDVFNPSEETRSLEMGFTTRTTGVDRMSYSNKEFTLKPGKNTVVLVLDRAMAKDTCYIDKVEYIHFEFPIAEERYELYVDNLCAHLTEEPVESKEKVYADSEILFFNDSADKGFVAFDSNYTSSGSAVTVSMNRNPKYIKEGTGSIKMQMGVCTSDTYTAVSIKGAPMDRLDLTNYSKVALSVCTDEPTTTGNLQLYIVDKNGLRASVGHVRELVAWGTPIEVGKWYTIEFDVETLKSKGFALNKISTIYCSLTNPKTGRDYAWYMDELKLIK